MACAQRGQPANSFGVLETPTAVRAETHTDTLSTLCTAVSLYSPVPRRTQLLEDASRSEAARVKAVERQAKAEAKAKAVAAKAEAKRAAAAAKKASPPPL